MLVGYITSDKKSFFIKDFKNRGAAFDAAISHCKAYEFNNNDFLDIFEVREQKEII